MRTSTQRVMAFVAMISAVGCFEEEDSCNVKTDGIFVEYEITESGQSADAKVTFWVGNAPGGTYLELGDCGDEIRVNGVRLAEAESNPTTYIASVDPASAYDFVFHRDGERQYISTVETPSPVRLIQAPNSGQSISRQNDIAIQWEAGSSPSDVSLEVVADCLYDFIGETSDDGAFTIESGELEAFEGEEDVTCDATLSVRRQVSGELDMALKGSIRGNAEVSRTFRSTP
ncbi:MAG: hypothetical protein MUC50_03120 [Myxococcota bacterium]|nr:hypothetical protein [Myxococcota bacterium]